MLIAGKNQEDNMKVAILKVSPEILVEFIKSLIQGFKGSEYEIIKNALPDDVVLLDVGAFSNAETAEHFPTDLFFKLTSESFEDIPRGHRLPEYPSIIFQKKLKEKNNV